MPAHISFASRSRGAEKPSPAIPEAKANQDA